MRGEGIEGGAAVRGVVRYLVHLGTGEAEDAPERSVARGEVVGPVPDGCGLPVMEGFGFPVRGQREGWEFGFFEHDLTGECVGFAIALSPDMLYGEGSEQASEVLDLPREARECLVCGPPSARYLVYHEQ